MLLRLFAGIPIVIKNPRILRRCFKKNEKSFLFYIPFPLSLLVFSIDYSSFFLYICGNTVFLRRNEVSNKVQTMVTGNLISLIAAFFTVSSSWSKDRKRIFLYQAMQCFLLAIANIFFLSVSGTTTYALCAFRNLFIAYDRFTNKVCIIFLISVTAIGFFANNRGMIGYLPILTTALYTVICFYAKETKPIKLNIIFNLTLWAIYDIAIHDFVSFTVDTVSAGTAVVSLFR